MSSSNWFDLTRVARPNILALQPYRCARDDYKDNGTNVLLDANENAWGPGLDLSSASQAVGGLELASMKLNRYPDPHQEDLKQLVCNLRNHPSQQAPPLTPANLFVGVGSDEAIDGLIRCFCAPGRDKILTCPPTYGMYHVSAQVNDVALVHVPLTSDTFDLDVEAVLAAVRADPSIKLMYLCSPGNPTGKLLSRQSIQALLAAKWQGIIVVDEAYVDYSTVPSSNGTQTSTPTADASLATWTTIHPNLVVMQTLSKAFGLAALRLGIAFCPAPIASLLNSLKAPYNISGPTSALAMHALSASSLATTRQHIASTLTQRDRLVGELKQLEGVGACPRGGGLDANFLLVQLLDTDNAPSNTIALAVYERLAEHKGVVVRFRGKEQWCEGCLRITVGTDEEVTRLLRELRAVLVQVRGGEKKAANGTAVGAKDEAREEVASLVVT